jgi:hypothetical protein
VIDAATFVGWFAGDAQARSPTQAAYAALAEESERPLVARDAELARLAGRLPRG